MKVRKHNYYVGMKDLTTHIFRTYSTADYFRKMNEDKIMSFNDVILPQRTGAGNQYDEINETKNTD